MGNKEFRYISHARGTYELSTIEAPDLETAWEIADDRAAPFEAGIVLPAREWNRLVKQDHRKRKNTGVGRRSASTSETSGLGAAVPRGGRE